MWTQQTVLRCGIKEDKIKITKKGWTPLTSIQALEQFVCSKDVINLTQHAADVQWFSNRPGPNPSWTGMSGWATFGWKICRMTWVRAWLWPQVSPGQVSIFRPVSQVTSSSFQVRFLREHLVRAWHLFTSYRLVSDVWIELNNHNNVNSITLVLTMSL